MVDGDRSTTTSTASKEPYFHAVRFVLQGAISGNDHPVFTEADIIERDDCRVEIIQQRRLEHFISPEPEEALTNSVAAVIVLLNANPDGVDPQGQTQELQKARIRDF